MRLLTPLPLFIPLSLFITSCGPDCKSSCRKAFGDGAEECRIVRVPGASPQDNIDSCFGDCEGDLSNPSREGDRIQWMDCIKEVLGCDACSSDPEGSDCEDAQGNMEFCFQDLGSSF